MSLSIRTRLTLWYSSIVVVTLATGAVAGWFMQWQLTFQYLDEDIARSMATLEGVMRTEFGKGLTLEGAADEASIEVVVPDRTLLLRRPDGFLLEVWGLPLDSAFLPPLGHDTNAVTLSTGVGDLRVLRHQVEHAGHRYQAAVIATPCPFARASARDVPCDVSRHGDGASPGGCRRLGDRTANAEAIDPDG